MTGCGVDSLAPVELSWQQCCGIADCLGAGNNARMSVVPHREVVTALLVVAIVGTVLQPWYRVFAVCRR